MSLPTITEARALLPQLRDLRRGLHQNPETGLDLTWTQARVEQAIADLDVEVTRGTTLRSSRSCCAAADAPTQALRLCFCGPIWMRCR